MRTAPLSPLLVLLAACLPGPRVHPRAAEEVARGYVHLQSGDAERAEVAFEHALEFDPDLPEALNGLGVVERRKGRVEEARRHFERAVRVSPDFAEGHVNLGESLLAEGEADMAEEELRAALAIDPDLAVARLDLARALLHRGRVDRARRGDLWDGARREYLHLLESAPDLAEGHHDLAYMDYENGALARAEAGYRRAVELDPRYVEALHGWCISLARLGRCREAVAACRRCVEVSPVPQCQQSLRGALACE